MAEVKVIVSGHLRQLSCYGLSPLGGLSISVWVLTGDVKIQAWAHYGPYLKFTGGIWGSSAIFETDKPRNLLITLANDSC